MTKLVQGRFYWIRMVIGEERTNVIPETVWAPARYTGKSADTYAREETRGDEIVIAAYSLDTWDFVGFRSDDGHHFVDVMEVGEEIVRYPESDAGYRTRILQALPRGFSQISVMTASGIELDKIGNLHNVIRK